jgi:endonuclease YncB( thermonuclease family)
MTITRTRVLAVLAAVGLAIPTALAATPVQAASGSVSWTTATVVRWIDGDTVDTSKGRVRLIGVDTPEKGRCGAGAATATARRLAPVGSTIRLGNPTSVKDRDRYQRHLRYVDRGGVDIAARQIVKGARARYDSRDGYQWHPRQTRYRTLDRRYRNYSCTTSGGGTTTSSWATRANSPVSATNPDLDCGGIPAAYKPIRITGPDYHRLDADSDGWGCEG